MIIMSQKPYMGGAHSFTLDGEIYPGNVDYTDPLYTKELFKMYHRNEFVQIMCDWMVAEAFRNWIKFIEDEGPIEGTKFGEPYTFKGYEYEDEDSLKAYNLSGFQEYIQWNDVPALWKQGVSWSRLYNEGSLLVFLDGNEELIKVVGQTKKTTTIKWEANTDGQGYSRFIVFQPFAVGTETGFKVNNDPGDVDDAGNVLYWTVHMKTQHMRQGKIFKIAADRCVHLLWKKRQNGWKACSRVAPMLRFCKFEELTFQKLTKRAHDLAGGILTFTGVESAKEQASLDSAMGDDLTSVDRAYLKAGRDMEYKTPDLKAAGEFSTIFELYTKKLCRFMRIDQLMLDGEHTGASMGGNDNVQQQNSYTEIYEIQEHYRNYLEKVFYKLGKTNTSFIYREVLEQPQGMEEDENEGPGEDGGSDGPMDSGDKKSSGNKSKTADSEQTR